MWGPTGITRLFNAEMGTQISWLIPAALLVLVGLLWVARRAPRTDGLRAAALLWGSWLVVTGLVFSFAAGIIHPYYTVALAPAIGALVGIGGVRLWQDREALVAGAAGRRRRPDGVWSFELLGRTPDWQPWLRYACSSSASASALASPLPRARLAAPARARGRDRRASRRCSQPRSPTRPRPPRPPHSGAIPTAGPAAASAASAAGRGFRRASATEASADGGVRHARAAAGRTAGRRVRPGRGFGQRGGFGRRRVRRPGGERRRARRAARRLHADEALVTLLEHARQLPLGRGGGRREQRGRRPARERRADHGDRRLQRDRPDADARAVQGRVAAGQIHYFLAGAAAAAASGGGAARRSRAGSPQHFSSRTVGGVTVYDLTARTA